MIILEKDCIVITHDCVASSKEEELRELKKALRFPVSFEYESGERKSFLELLAASF